MAEMMWGYGAAVGEMHKKKLCHTVELQQYDAGIRVYTNSPYGEMSGSCG